MKTSTRWIFLGLLGGSSVALAADGLVAPAADTLWPNWRARISVQTSDVASLHPTRWAEAQADPRGARSLAGAAVLGDYTFAQPWFGSLRATSGLVVGNLAGVASRMAASGWGGNVAGETLSTVPYVGLGFSRQALQDGLSIVADVGVVAQSPTNFGNLGRAVFGNAGVENAWRDMRLSPMWQLGVRYAF